MYLDPNFHSDVMAHGVLMRTSPTYAMQDFHENLGERGIARDVLRRVNPLYDLEEQDRSNTEEAGSFLERIKKEREEFFISKTKSTIFHEENNKYGLPKSLISILEKLEKLRREGII